MFLWQRRGDLCEQVLLGDLAQLEVHEVLRIQTIHRLRSTMTICTAGNA